MTLENDGIVPEDINIRKCQNCLSKHRRFGCMTLLQCEQKPLTAHGLCTYRFNQATINTDRLLSNGDVSLLRQAVVVLVSTRVVRDWVMTDGSPSAASREVSTITIYWSCVLK